jgi:hypothetical protein
MMLSERKYFPYPSGTIMPFSTRIDDLLVTAHATPGNRLPPLGMLAVRAGSRRLSAG